MATTELPVAKSLPEPAAFTDTISGPNLRPMPSGAVLVWATVGFLWLAYIVIGGGWWVLESNHFGKAPTGADHLSTLHLVFIRSFELASIGVTLWFIWTCLIVPIRAGQGLTRDGMLVLGTTFAYFIDPLVNLFSYTFAYNAHGINVGSWEQVFPLHTGPATHFGEGIAWALPQYVYFGLGGSLIACWAFAKLQARWPTITKTQCFALYLAGFFVFDTILEYACIRFELYSYARTWKPLTINPGSQYQWPIYEGLISGLYSAGIVYVRVCWAEGKQSFLDRGLERLKVSQRHKTTALALAVIGFCAAWAFFAWFAPWSWQSAGATSVANLPSYLRPGP
jgi:Spirocyclase AveC-like